MSSWRSSLVKMPAPSTTPSTSCRTLTRLRCPTLLHVELNLSEKCSIKCYVAYDAPTPTPWVLASSCRSEHACVPEVQAEICSCQGCDQEYNFKLNVKAIPGSPLVLALFALSRVCQTCARSCASLQDMLVSRLQYGYPVQKFCTVVICKPLCIPHCLRRRPRELAGACCCSSQRTGLRRAVGLTPP